MINIKKIGFPAVIKPGKILNNAAFGRISGDVFERSSEPAQIRISHMKIRVNTPQNPSAAAKRPEFEQVDVRFNPQNRALIYKKVKNQASGEISKIPCEVYVAESQKDGWQTTYHFLEKDTKKEAGYVTIDDWHKLKQDSPIWDVYENSALLDDYPQLGIKGRRISIEYLQNNDESLFSGIGTAADQLAVEYCLKNGLKPNITSVADYESHIAHYNRGRRFFEISKNDVDIDAYEFLADFGTLNPNKIIEKRISAAKPGEHIDTSDLGALHMYMPQEVIQKYLAKIEKNPILKADF